MRIGIGTDPLLPDHTVAHRGAAQEIFSESLSVSTASTTGRAVPTLSAPLPVDCAGDQDRLHPVPGCCLLTQSFVGLWPSSSPFPDADLGERPECLAGPHESGLRVDGLSSARSAAEAKREHDQIQRHNNNLDDHYSHWRRMADAASCGPFPRSA